MNAEKQPDVHMAQLRHKLENSPAQPGYLLTEARIGDRFQFNDFSPNASSKH